MAAAQSQWVQFYLELKVFVSSATSTGSIKPVTVRPVTTVGAGRFFKKRNRMGLCF